MLQVRAPETHMHGLQEMHVITFAMHEKLH
jgi:hypothetical protein